MNGNGEETPLLGKKQPLKQRLRTHLTANINQKYGDIPLFIGYIATGLLDSSSVFIFNCFVSMQTGNTIYLGLGLVEPQASDRWIKSLISIIAFCVGAFLFARMHHALGEYKRWVLMASYSIQTLLLMISAFLVTFGPQITKETPVSVWVALPLSLVALQSAGQTYTSRALKFNALTSVVLTTNYCDLFADPKLFAGLTANPERNRRIIAPLMLLLGAFLGGVFAHSPLGLEAALWTGVGLKTLVTIAWFLFPEEKEDDDDE